MQNASFSSKNVLNAGASWYGDKDVAFPLTNFADKDFGKIWRYTPGVANADGLFARFAYSVASPVRTNHWAMCKHNLGPRSQVRVRCGTAKFDADFTTDSPLDYDILWGGGTNGTRINEYGVQVTNVCPRYEHDRRYYENGFLKAEDLTDTSAWTVTGTRYSDGRHLYLPAITGAFGQTHGPVYPDTYEILALCRCKEGDGQLTMLIQGVTSFGVATGTTKTVGSDWQWVTWTCVVPSFESSTAFSRLFKPNGAAGGMFEFAALQFRRGLSGGKYRKTTTQRRYQRRGLIREQGSTNLLLRSQDYANVWTKGANVTIVSYMGGAPDGGSFSLHNVNCTAAGQGFSQVISSVPGNSIRAFTVMFKRGGSCTSASIAINWFNGGTVNSVVCTFNPATGAFISSTNSPLQAGVEDMGEGFYRAYVIGLGTDALNTQANLQITWNAIGTIFLYGSQFEANVVTTYIPTTTAASTRAVDTMSIDGTTFVPLIWNQTEGTVYEETWLGLIPGNTTQGLGYVIAYSGVGGQTTNSMFCRVYELAAGGSSNVTTDFFAYNGGANTVATSGTALTRTAGIQRTAYRYRTNDFAFSVNGGAPVLDTSSNVPTVTTVDMAYQPGSTDYVRRVTIWPKGVPDASLQSLTSIGPSALDSDSGWRDALQIPLEDPPTNWGDDYNVIDTFTQRAVEWTRVELYDPSKTTNTATFDAGRVFVAKIQLTPADNCDWGLEPRWVNRTDREDAFDGTAYFTERPEYKECVLAYQNLSKTELNRIHEMQSSGISEEILFLPDADDEAECQRIGGVGYLKELDPMKYVQYGVYGVGFQHQLKR